MWVSCSDTFEINESLVSKKLCKVNNEDGWVISFHILLANVCTTAVMVKQAL